MFLSKMCIRDRPYKVRTLKYDIRDSKIKEYMRQDSAVTLLSEGMYFDVNVLDEMCIRDSNYPHCWRTDKPVLYYPLDSWFIRSTA